MKRFIFLSVLMLVWQAMPAQCTAPVVTAGGPTTFCPGGSVTLSTPVIGNTWVQKANYAGSPGKGAVGFSINDKGYIGTGDAGTGKSLWEYNPATNAWSQKANFSGNGRVGAAGFSIGSKGYIGTGSDGITNYKDFWEYNPAANTWAQKANFGGTARGLAVGFSAGGKGYIGTGETSSNVFTKDFWEYNPSTDTWIQKPDFPGAARARAAGFGIGSKGYIGTGKLAPNLYSQDFWEYNSATGTWVPRQNFPGVPRFDAGSFSIGDRGYLGIGYTNASYRSDLWEYNPATNTWAQKADYGGGGVINAIGFGIGSKGYLGVGFSGDYRSDFWEYNPGFTYIWSPGGQTTSSVTVNATGNYIVYVTNGLGCNAISAPTAVTVNTPATPVITASNSTTFCQGSSVTLTSSSATSYQWYLNGNILPGATMQSYTATTAGSYTVTTTNATGCSATSSPTTVTIYSSGTLYVDSSKTTSGDGSSWANAYTELREALFAAGQCSNITIINVAKGTYKPTNDANRDSAFAILRGGLKIYGGYPAGGGTWNVATNPTILSGDIGTLGNSTDNSYHVLVLAGIDNSADSVVLDGCTILNGTAGGSGTKLYNGQNTNRSSGGGLYLLNNAAGNKIVIRNCSITNNTGNNGGAVYSEASSPVFSNSNFVGNVAGSQGGAVYAYNNASPTFRNCFFRQNIAQDGGAISVFFYSPYSVNNCVFVQNNASGRGGAIYAANNSPATITNCTLVQNNALYGGAMSFNASSNTDIINTVAWGNTATAYPLFFNNSFITVDHSLVQEGYAGTGNVNADPLFINSADADGADNIFGTADDGLHLQAGSPAINTGSNTAVPAGVTTDITGAARIQNGTVDMGAYEGSQCPSFTTLYVDGSITTPGKGDSWANAFKELSSAMAAAAQCNSIITINVAKGTYKPTNDTNRDSTFAILRGGLKIYGGYPTGGGTRDIATNQTVLSGDLGVVGDVTDNSYHIIIIANPGSNADSVLIDGFTITKANAKGTGTKLFNGINVSRNDGGGIYAGGQVNSKTVIRNCTITANTAFSNGGGLNSQGGSSPSLINCTFANNNALLSGGGIYNNNCISFIKGCNFTGNNAFFGGGIRNSNSSVVVDSCIFSNNTGNEGGGAVQNEYSSPFFSKCIFINNFSQGGSSGGGMANIDGSPVVTNCMFIGNYSFENGTAVSNQNSQALFNSCTFSANYGNAGSVISTYGTTPVVVTNSVIWGNTKVSNGNPTVSNPVIYNSGGANTTITYSDVQGGYSGTGNISSDPLFINSADADGADNIFGTADDGLHLQAGSPAINTGSNAAVPAGITTDITGAARIQNGTVDMGAYEGSVCASFTTLYVDSSIVSPGKGGSWATAFKTVQQALDASNSCSSVKQVWIKKGTYYPTAYPANCTDCAANGTARDYTFSLRDGLALYGGFAGTETDTAQRVAGNTTILSGDIGTPNNNSDNCYHVLLAINSNNRLNGLTVTGGNANDNGVITVNGQAIYHSNGGGMYEYASSSALFNCTFTANAANSEGGGMYTVYCSALRINNSRYLNNHSGAGGAIRLLYGNTSFVSVNSIYAGNTASFNDGGAMSLVMGGGTDTLINNAFIKNVAFGSAAINGGGAIVQEDGTSSYMVNNTFYADSAASNGGALRFKAGGSNRYVYNNIFYKNYNGTANTDISLESGTTITTQSNNLYSTTNPLFINELNPAGADNVFGTADDGLQLQIVSPAVNTGSNAAVSANITTDIAGAVRIQNGTVDMGAYESPYASYSIATAVSASSVCNGSAIPVTYTAAGTYNSGNTFTAQLSGATGSFASPIAIGSVTATTSSVINAAIPAGTATGTGYRIRVVSSTPAVTGTDNGSNITVNALPAKPVVTTSGSTTFCSGGSVTLTAPASSSYLWSNGATTQAITISQSDSYTVTVANSTGCTSPASDATIVTVNALPAKPVITASGLTTFCAGGSVTLTAPVSASYLWSNGATTQSIILNSSGSYSVVVSNGNGCNSPASDAVVVTTNAASTKPVITAGGPTVFCTGGSVTLTTPTSASYLWSNGATTQSVTVNQSGSYTVSVTNAGGCTSPASDATVVTVNTLPAKPVITAGGPTTFCAGGSVTLTAPTGFTSYLWSNGATTQAITVNQSGSYTVAVTNGNSCTSPVSDVVAVSVYPLPAKPTITPSGATTFCTGSSVTLTAPVSSSYLWSNSATTRSITVTQSGSYNVSVTNSNGCTSPASDATVVSVNPLPAKPAITANGPITFCAGGSVILTAPVSASYLWSNGATTQAITVNQSGSYSVVVTNSNGCNSPVSDAVVVTTNAASTKPVVTASGPTVFCAGGSVTLTAPVSAFYLWSNGATTQAITVNQSGTYTVSVTNAGGCTSPASDAVTIMVNPLPAKPTITASGPTTFCAGGSVTLTAPVSASYLWNNGATTQSITVNQSSAYSVVVTNSNGCNSPASDVTLVTVKALPTKPVITASGPTTFCAGSSVALTAPVSAAYLWSNGATTQAITVNQNGFYTVAVTNGNGCTSPVSDGVAVTVNPLPAQPVITAGSATTFCAGGSVILTAPVSTSYLWSNGATTQSINVTQAGSYSVVVTNGNGCTSTASDATTVTVNPLPTKPIIAAGGATTFCAGSSVTLTAPVSASYLWSNGAITQSINVNQSGSYSVTVTNGNGCSSLASDVLIVTVNSLPAKPAITTSGPTAFCAGGSVTLTAPASASYLWSNGATTQAVTVNQSGSYSVTVANASGCTSLASDFTSVTVNALPIKPVVTTNGSTTFCSGSSVTLTAPVSASYLWSNGATTQSITVNQSGSYTVAVTNSNGCNSPVSNAIIVTVNALPAKPVITANGPTSFCAGGSVTLTAPASTSYLWSNGAVTQSITVNQSGSYSVVVTNSNGCNSPSSDAIVVTTNAASTKPVITANGPITFCVGGSVTLSVPVATSYLWSNGATTQSITVNQSGSYTVSVTNAGGCTSPVSEPAIVTVNPLPAKPTITASGPTTFCAGSSVTLTAPVSTSYQWNNGATTQSITVNQSGAYSVVVTNSNGCTSPASDVTTVTVNTLPAKPVITANGPTSFCSGGSITLTAPASTSYLWSNGAITQSITINQSGSYTVTVTNSNGCTSPAADNVAVTVNALPVKPTIAVGGSTTFCAGGSVILTAPLSASYLWSNGATTQSITVNQSGSYNVVVKNSNGCSSPASDATVVSVNPLPAKPVITASGPVTFNQGGSVTLTAPAAASYLWSNGAVTQSVTVTTSGSYTVKVTNSSGCTSPASDPVTVTVQATPSNVSVSHLNADGQLTNNHIRPYLQLNNEGSTPVAYSSLTVRYWLTVEDFAPMTNLVIDWAQLGSNKVIMKYVKLPQPRAGAFGYIEYSFAANAGNLAAMSNSGPIQSRAGKSDWTDFNEANDYSYAAYNNYTKNNRITLYQNGSLVWGTEPAAITAVQSLKAYSQDKSSGTVTNTLSPWLKVNNEGNTPVSYKDITVRYWFTADGTQPLNYVLDYAQLGSNNVTSKFVKLATPLNGADTYLELGFTAVDSLYPISTTGNVQQRIAKNDWSQFNQGNDHSYKAGSSAMSENMKVTVYVKGVLVYGIEPAATVAIAKSNNTAASEVQSAMVSVIKGTTVAEAQSLSVAVLNNPVMGNEAALIVRGVEGEQVQVMLMDEQGKIISIRAIQKAGATENVRLSVSNSAAATLFIRVSTPKESKTVKVVRLR